MAASKSPLATSVLLAYEPMFRASATLTSAHWSLIHNYLIRPSKELTEEERAELPVSPDQGTGNASHAETEGIRDMRRLHPVGKLLADAAKTLRMGERRFKRRPRSEGREPK